MRILFLSNLYPPYEPGGYGQHCHEVAIRLKKRGHDVKVLTSRHGLSLVQEDDIEGVTRTLFLQTDMDYYRPLDFFLKRSRQERKNLYELRKIVDKFQPDVIMVWGMWNLSFNLPFWAEKLMPHQVVYYIGSYWPIDIDPHIAYWQLPARRPITELIKKPLRALALFQLRRENYPPQLRFEHAICSSQFVRDELVRAKKLSPSTQVIYSGIDPEPFMQKNYKSGKFAQEGAIRLIYFGRLIGDKGVHTAIEAVVLLQQRGLADQLDLTIVGDGHPDYENYLREMVNRFGISELVHFVGRVPIDDIPDYLTNFDVFLFTSVWPEPFGRTIVEAMLAGLVVIGSNVGGSREIFQHYGEELMFQPEDASALAERINRVRQDPDLCKHLVNKGRQLALEQFTLNLMIDEIEEYVLEINHTLVSTNFLPLSK